MKNLPPLTKNVLITACVLVGLAAAGMLFVWLPAKLDPDADKAGSPKFGDMLDYGDIDDSDQSDDFGDFWEATATPAPRADPKIAVPTEEQRAELADLMSGEAIRLIDIGAYDSLSRDTYLIDILKKFGRTRSIGDNAAYYVNEDGNRSLFQLTTTGFKTNYYYIPNNISAKLSPLGQTYTAASNKQSGSLQLPDEAVMKALISEAMKLRDLFVVKTMITVRPVNQNGPNWTTIDGAAGYYKVVAYEAYSSVDQINAALERYFWPEKAKQLTDLKVYAMLDGQLYARTEYSNEEAGDWSDPVLFVRLIDETAGEVIFNAVIPGNGQYLVKMVKVRFSGGVWKLS